MKDATGREIKVGDSIVHACSSYGRRVRMRTGVVTKLRAVEQTDRWGKWSRETVWYGNNFARDPRRVIVTSTVTQ